MLLFYSFDDDSEPLVAVDESGQGNDGIISGNDFDGDGVPDTPALYTDPGLGRTGAGEDRAIDFLTTAEGTYISVPNAATSAFDSMTGNDAATVAMWLYGSDAQPVNQWNFWFGPGRQLGSHVPWSDGVIYFDVAGCCAGNQRINIGEPDASKWRGQWNHYAFVKELEFTRIYQNGVLLIEAGGKSPLGTITEVFFGAGDSTHVANYNGLMDDIGVWDQALSEDEIIDVMENGIGPPKPISIKRDIPDTLVNGTSGVVTLTVTPRVPGGAVVVINEKLPAGLTPSNPSQNGVLAGDTITWNLGKVETEIVLSYTMTASPDAANAKLLSTATMNGEAIGIGGDTAYTGSFFTTKGFIRLWNHLGPLAWAFPSAAGDHGPPGACDANAGAELSLDWIVSENGTINENNIQPFPGLVTRPQYGGDGLPGGTGARAAGLVMAAGDTGVVVQDSSPVWKSSLNPGDTIDHASTFVHGFDAEDHLTLSFIYVTNNTQAPIDTQVGVGSDDSIQIFVNDVDITAGGQGVICRGWGAANEEQNVFPATLQAGENRVLVKVTDGCCGSGFRLRFQDPAGEPDPLTGYMPGLLPPTISVRLESPANPAPGSATRTLAKDTYAEGESIGVSVEVDLKAASDVTIKETLPAGATAAAISDGGTQNGTTVEWRLTGVQKKSVSYQVSAPLCPGSLALGQGTVVIGSNEIETGGPSQATRVYREDNLGAWTSRDIGATGGAVERLGDHELLVRAVGSGVGLLKDEFRFVSVPASGDFEVSTRIDCLDDPNRRGLAGLMARNTDDQGSANIFFSLSPTAAAGFVGTLRATYRNDTAKTTRPLTIADNDVEALPIYLKLARVGNKVSLHRSADGVSYPEVASRDIVNVNPTTTQINLAPDLMIGLGATGGLTGNSVRANFVQVTGPAFGVVVPPGKKFRRGDPDASAALDVTDAITLLNYLFTGGPKPVCLDAADVDDNGEADISDAIANLSYQFLGAAAPADPGPTTCGVDKNEETPDLGCDQPCV